MVVTLHEAKDCHAQIIGCKEDQNQSLSSLCLIVEPNNGGDYHVEGVKAVQIKTSSKPWSFIDVVKRVLPDLFQAVDLKKHKMTYHFVTNKEKAKGFQGEEFLKRVRELASYGCCWENLDNSESSRSYKNWKTSNGTKGECGRCLSEYEVFERITETLWEAESRRCRKTKTEIDDVFRQKVWQLLKNFVFEESRREDEIRCEVENFLYKSGIEKESIDAAFSSLHGDLLEYSRRGNAKFMTSELFDKIIGKPVPFDEQHWNSLCQKSRERVNEHLLDLEAAGQFIQNDCIRDSRARQILSQCSDNQIYALTGDSGNGKSWLLYMMTRLLAENKEEDEILLFVEDNGDEERFFRELKEDLWKKIAQHSRVQDFDNVFSLLDNQYEELHKRKRWITVFIDNLMSPDIAKKIGNEMRHNAWRKIRFFTTCLPHFYKKHMIPNKCQEIEIPEYSLEETRAYVKKQGKILDEPYSPLDSVYELDNDYDKHNSAYNNPYNSVYYNPLFLKLICELYSDVRIPYSLDKSAKTKLMESYWTTLFRKMGEGRCLAEFQKKVCSLFFEKTHRLRTFDLSDFEYIDDIRKTSTSLIVPVKLDNVDLEYKIRHDLFLSYAIAKGIMQKFSQDNLSFSDFKLRAHCIIDEKNECYSSMLIRDILEFCSEIIDEECRRKIFQDDQEQIGKFNGEIDRMLQRIETK